MAWSFDLEAINHQRLKLIFRNDEVHGLNCHTIITVSAPLNSAGNIGSTGVV
jgi:hypothetical protein